MPKHLFSPRATLYSPPPSLTANCRVVQIRYSPGSKRSITSPRLTRSQRQPSFLLIFSAISSSSRQPPAVHRHHLPVDVVASRRTQKQRRACHVLRLAPSSRRYPFQNLF